MGKSLTVHRLGFWTDYKRARQRKVGAVSEVTVLKKRWKTVLCSLLIAGASCGLYAAQQKPADEAAALSFPYSPALLEQLSPKLSMRLLELVPSQETDAERYPEKLLYPGGQAIGILLRTDGILVVGQSPITVDNQQVNPAEEAGIQAGDVITQVNGATVTHDDQLALLVNQLGEQNQPVVLQIKRQNRQLTKEITPVYCADTKSYRIGLLIRDNAGGVGTLTFVDPQTMEYGALGHMISNNETQSKINILKGKLVAADIQGIKKGIDGYPGEKIGRFVSNQSLGSIEKNTAAGIFGVLTDEQLLTESPYQQALPTAAPSEIVLGPAQILTAIDGNKVETFTVEIEKIMPTHKDGKGLVIRVTDPVLLEKTGGIVQGMSGSPIIQNGKIIGAVTHVFINDPTRGYGILIHDMLQQTSILEETDTTQQAAA